MQLVSPSRPMRILFTNNTLASRAGSELFVFDLAVALHKRGHQPIAFSTVLGEVADQLRSATIPVIDDLASLTLAPDVIHGQHHLELATALLRFPDTPAIHVCHGWLPWEEEPLLFPTIRKYVAVSALTRERLLTSGIPADLIEIVPNSVDTERFRPRGRIHGAPTTAAVFSNYFRRDDPNFLEIVFGCRGLGFSKVDLFGASAEAPLSKPEDVLPQYDVVFAAGRCAIEALACGCAVIVADHHGFGRLVTPANLEELSLKNFGLAVTQGNKTTAAKVAAEIGKVDPLQVAAVCDTVRERASLSSAVLTWERIYLEAMARPARATPPVTQAASDYLRKLNPVIKHRHEEWLSLLRKSHDAQGEISALQQAHAAELQQAETQRGTLTSALAETQAREEELVARLKQAEAQLAALKRAHAAELQQAETQRGALASALAAAQARGAELETLLNVVQAQLADVEKKSRSSHWLMAQLGRKLIHAPRDISRRLRKARRKRRKLKRDLRLISRSGLFDRGWYVSQNPDVRASGVDPLVHYLRHGAFEGRAPGPRFDSRRYLEERPDVALSGVNPLVHYLRHGRAEGRARGPVVNVQALDRKRRRKYLTSRMVLRFEPILPRRLADRMRRRMEKNDLPLVARPRATAPYVKNGPIAVFVSHEARVGGAPRVLLNIASWFQRRTDYDIRLVLMEGGEWVSDFEAVAPTLVVGSMAPSRDQIPNLREARRDFIGEKPAFVFVNSAASGFFLEINPFPATTISYVHELSKLLRTCQKQAELVLEKSDLILCAGPQVRAVLTEEYGVDRQRLVEMRPFISLSPPSAPQNIVEKGKARERLGCLGRSRVVMACGTVHWRKSPEIFVRMAVEFARRGRHDVQFVWVGDGPDLNRMMALAKEQGVDRSVEFVGARTDFRDLVAVADVFALPSLEDPFPLVCLEAGAAGVPSVVFREAGGIHAFVEPLDEPPAGMVVALGDEAAFFEAVLRLVDDDGLRAKLGEVARRRVFDRHETSSACGQILKLVRDTASLPPRVSIVVPPRKKQTLKRDLWLISRSGLFDRGWYLSQNPDVRAAGVDPLVHYLRHGAFEGRAPGPKFDSRRYLEEHPDVAASGVNPLVHYLRHGRAEGRARCPSSSEVNLHELAQKRRRKYLTSRMVLRFEPILPRRLADRMRRRMEKNAPPMVARPRATAPYVKDERASKAIASLKFPDLAELSSLKPRHRIAVVVHIYYAELWEEISRYLRNIHDGYDLFVSLVEGASQDIAPNILEYCPTAHVFVFPNHGRDVYPFIAFLNTGVLDRYELVLKLHSKVTIQDPEVGRAWRKEMFDGLLGSPERVRGIITSFRANERLGLVGPASRLFGPGHPAWFWHRNATGLLWLEQRVGIPAICELAAFIAGTMFWVRPAALAALKGRLRAEEFDPEPIPHDGALQHAVERYIGIVTAGAGFRIAATEALLFCGESQEEPAPAPRDVLSTRWNVLRQVPAVAGERICLFATWSVEGKLWEHTLAYCRRLRSEGIKVILIVATDRADLAVADPGPQVCDGLIARENAGFDFASWAQALKLAPDLWSASMLYFANDSVYGPFGDFAQILKRIEQSPAEFVGLTATDDLESHFQSYFFALKGRALKNESVRKFWDEVKAVATKNEAIAAYELVQLSRFSAAGLSCEALFPASKWGERRNPTLFLWRELIEDGFPFIKVQLLRDNPERLDLTGWDALLRERGYDPQLIRTHLEAIRPNAPALQAGRAPSGPANVMDRCEYIRIT